MPNLVVVGGQWGDEGKGKIIDVLTGRFQAIVRYQGGHNAGHTIRTDDATYPLHLIPSGILHPGKVCVIGNGVVVSPAALLEEIGRLESHGIKVAGRFHLSDRAHVIFPYHAALDVGREGTRGEKKLGTTSRGIGPAYEDRSARVGLRVGDLLNRARLEEKLLALAQEKTRLLAFYGMPPVDGPALLAEAIEHGRRLAPYATDTATLLNRMADQGASLLFEGAQGALLDIDHGTYPYVTSSNSSVGGVCAGAGIAPTRIHGSLGIFKAYCTRVGGGPFPTEQDNPTGEQIRARGHEYGTTTGRPRRCGWFDAVAARYAVRTNDFSAIALTLLDVLDAFDEIRICVGYEAGGGPIDDFPSDPWLLRECRPVYTVLPGWRSETAGIDRYEDLPQAARNYVRAIEDLVGREVAMIGTGPERRKIVLREDRSFIREFLPPAPGVA